eukprot:TRINITY_DN3012_c0_g1_i2.p1 TRINITY_DN3012_c0_g1~~TRINITY_DN3012_c0_g1_i2.p1  ORF type:complete len:277 (+),score=63.69 TRINITY_DN3012_c0_g1_i2:826-1656(+)
MLVKPFYCIQFTQFIYIVNVHFLMQVRIIHLSTKFISKICRHQIKPIMMGEVLMEYHFPVQILIEKIYHLLRYIKPFLGKVLCITQKNRKKEKERTKRLLSYQDKESLIGNGSLPSETQRKFAELNEQNDNFLIDGNSEQQLNSTKGKTKRKLFLTAASKTKGPKHVLPSNNSSPSNTQIKETNSMVDSSPDIKIELEGTYKGQFSFDEDDFLETQSQLNFDFDFSFNPQKETERAIFEDLMSFELLLRRHPSAIDHVEVDLLYSKILEGMSDKVD